MRRYLSLSKPTNGPTLGEVQAIIAELVAEGLVRDSGRRESGRIVWVASEFLDGDTSSNPYDPTPGDAGHGDTT